MKSFFFPSQVYFFHLRYYENSSEIHFLHFYFPLCKLFLLVFSVAFEARNKYVFPVLIRLPLKASRGVLRQVFPVVQQQGLTFLFCSSKLC